MFDATFKFFIGNRDEIVEMINKDKSIEQDSKEHLYEVFEDNNVSSLFLPMIQDSGYRINYCFINDENELDFYIVHEIQHAVYAELKSKGVEHSIETDEVYSYFNGWLVSEVLKKLKKLEKKDV